METLAPVEPPAKAASLEILNPKILLLGQVAPGKQGDHCLIDTNPESTLRAIHTVARIKS